MATDISILRQELNDIDKELSALFARRMQISAEVAEYKRENNMPVLDKSREREILNRVAADKPEEVAPFVRMLYSNIFELSRSYQNSLLAPVSELSEAIEKAMKETPELMPTAATVACQGVEGAYSQIACDRLFPFADISFMDTFEGVFRAVSGNLCRYGVLPIENNIGGSVNQVYDLMKKYNFHIVRSIRQRVNHCLAVRPGTKKEDIKRVFSHEQALRQCGGYLKKMGVEACPYANTAMAARMVASSEDKTLAAICSRVSAEGSGLVVLEEGIQDNDNNYTRFICISKTSEIYPGADRISLMMTLPHKPGSLYSLMSSFASLGINVTKLESRPMAGRDFEFMFYLDIEASVCDEAVRKLLSRLENELPMFAFLGAYTEK